MTPNNATGSAPDKTSDSAAFIILSMLAVLAGFAMALSIGPQSAGVMAIFLFGNPALWTALLILGWRWYGRATLWLLLVAPFAFLPVLGFLLFACLFGGCGHR